MSARQFRPTIKSLVRQYLEQKQPALIDQTELASVKEHVRSALGSGKKISDRYLIDLLYETDVKIARSLGGLPVDLRGRVHFGGPKSAESSLLDLEREYRQAQQQGDAERQEDCRRAVRQAKDRLKMLLGRQALSAEKRAEKEELLHWFLVWLETPLLFSDWLELRKQARKEK